MKNWSSDYVYGRVDLYSMVIEVLCIIDGIVGCALGVAKIDVKFELHPQKSKKRSKEG